MHQIWIKSYVAIVWHDIISENETAKLDGPWSLQVDKNGWWKHFIGLNVTAQKLLHKGLMWMFFLWLFCCCILCSTHITTHVLNHDKSWNEFCGESEKTSANRFGPWIWVWHMRASNSIVWAWDFNHSPGGSVEWSREELPENNGWTRLNFQWG